MPSGRSRACRKLGARAWSLGRRECRARHSPVQRKHAPTNPSWAKARPGAHDADKRDLDQPMTVDVDARSFGPMRLAEAHQLHDPDLKAVNTKEQPDRIQPSALKDVRIDGQRIRMTLAPASWNVLHFQLT